MSELKENIPVTLEGLTIASKHGGGADRGGSAGLAADPETRGRVSLPFNDPEDFRLWGLEEKVHLRIRHALQLGWTDIRWVDVTEQWVGIRPDKNTFRFRIPELPEETHDGS